MEITAAVTRKADAPPRLEALTLDAPRDDELLIRIVAAGICHTDLSAPALSPLPAVFGHEGAGIVEAVGSAVRDFHPGDRVCLSFGSCGGCGACHEEAPAYCDHMMQLQFGGVRLDGTTTLHDGHAPVHGAFFQQSSFATYALATARNTVHVPDDIPLEIAAPFGCGIQTGAGAVLNVLDLDAHESLVVFGAGSVGLAAIMAAAVVGCTPVVAVDPIADRRALAMSLGATHTVDPTDHPDLLRELRDLCPGGAHASLETAGHVQSFTTAIDVLRMRGTCGLVTVPNMGRPFEFSPVNLLFGRRLVGILEGASVPEVFLPRLFDLYRQGRLPVDRLIRRYPFSDIAAAMADSASGRTVKPVLCMEEQTCSEALRSAQKR